MIHTLGYPLKQEEFGGAFLYAMPDGLVSFGLVTGLDYRDPMFDPHVNFQHLKQHPLIASILKGGQMVRYGAKALPEGGWYTIPRVYADGVLIAGDAGGFVNSVRLKGLHLAMRTGMLAAETAFEAIRAGDTSAATLSAYERRINDGDVRRELHGVRNVHQVFSHGLLPGMMAAGLGMFTKGWWFQDPAPVRRGISAHQEDRRVLRRGRTAQRRCAGAAGEGRSQADVRQADQRALLRHAPPGRSAVAPDRARHEHLRDALPREYGNPCTRFCPANVYEMVDAGDGTKKLQINPSNCVHCKTCDIMDPYQVIDWVPPEGGGGPQYKACRGAGRQVLGAGDRIKASLIAAVASPLIAVLCRTYRWTIEGADHYDAVLASGKQPILALWHGRILPGLHYFRDRGIVVITSQNFDGEWIARILHRLGFGTARGSTSRGGARALVQLRREMAAGQPAAFTVDGPRGPARVVQPGVAFLAGVTGNPILPYHIEADRYWTLGSWDRTQIPRPFSRVALVIGPPIPVSSTGEAVIEAALGEVSRSLTVLEARAAGLLGQSPLGREVS